MSPPPPLPASADPISYPTAELLAFTLPPIYEKNKVRPQNGEETPNFLEC